MLNLDSSCSTSQPKPKLMSIQVDLFFHKLIPNYKDRCQNLAKIPTINYGIPSHLDRNSQARLRSS